MEHEPIIVENVKHIEPAGRRWLEDVLGQHLQEHQQVFIMVLSPGQAPDDEARRQARAALSATFGNTAAYAEEHGVTEAEVDAAIREAMDHVRPGPA